MLADGTYRPRWWQPALYLLGTGASALLLWGDGHTGLAAVCGAVCCNFFVDLMPGASWLRVTREGFETCDYFQRSGCVRWRDGQHAGYR